jgi:hypothetical protein
VFDVVRQDRTDSGTVMMVRLDDLSIDPTYQRPLSKAKVDKIAEAFNPLAVGVLLVSRREGGELYVYDGQHRLAAMRRLGIKEVRCLVFDEMVKEEESGAFVSCNTVRGNPRARDVFRALLSAKDPSAQAIERIVENCGMKLHLDKGSGPNNSISAVSALQRIYDRAGSQMLHDVLTIIGAAWPRGTTSERAGILILGVAVFLQMYPEADRARLVDQLSSKSANDLTIEATRTAQVLGVYAGKAVAWCVWKAYNHRLTTRRLADRFTGRITDLEAAADVQG